jgi:hypothetical protein
VCAPHSSCFTFECLLSYILMVLVYAANYFLVHIFKDKAGKEEGESVHSSEFY